VYPAMSNRDAPLIDAVSRSMVDLQTSPSGSLGELRQHDDRQSSEGQLVFLLVQMANFLTPF